MCNPRRIRVTATRAIAEAWQYEVRQTAYRRGVAVGEARIREPLGATIGAPALAALAGALARSEDWELRGDAFHHELEGGYVRYDPGTRELEIVATAAAEVEVSAEASAEVRGVVEDEISAEGIGRYYDDEWGGVTEADARAAAEQAAVVALDATVRRRVDAAQREAAENQGEALLGIAAARAAEAFELTTTERERELREQAAARLDAVGIAGRRVFHEALAAAYRDAILAYARSRGAGAIRCSTDGGVVDIEFELDIA